MQPDTGYCDGPACAACHRNGVQADGDTCDECLAWDYLTEAIDAEVQHVGVREADMTAEVRIYPAAATHVGMPAAVVMVIVRGGAMAGSHFYAHIFGGAKPTIKPMDDGVMGFNEHMPLGRQIVEAYRRGQMRVDVDLLTGAELVAA